MKRLDYLYEKYVMSGLCSNEIFTTAISIDPTSVVKDGIIQKVGKYSQWLLRSVDEISYHPEALFTRYSEYVHELLFKFDKIKHYLKEKDINQYTVGQLVEIVQQYWNEKILFTKKEWKYKVKRDNVKYVFENEKFDIVVPLNEDASYELAGTPLTNWCTAVRKESKFYQYHKPLYIIRDKEQIINYGKGKGEPRPVFQFHFHTFFFADHNNDSINIVKFLQENPDLKDFFRKDIQRRLDKSNFFRDKLMWAAVYEIYGVEFFKDKMWAIMKRYVRHFSDEVVIGDDNIWFKIAFEIYGYEKILKMVFKHLPSTIKELSIHLSGYSGDGYCVPKTIQRLKNIEYLRLEGFLKKIPESFGCLEKLSVLSLCRNKVKTIPECLLNLKSLEIIDIRETEVDHKIFNIKKNVYVKHGNLK